MTASTPPDWVLSVPNFSEGRRATVLAGLVSALRAPGVALLDVHADADHHRSVVTLAGPPSALMSVLLAGVTFAAAHIDLPTHTGQHPRLGATDVVPFVPLGAATTLEQCVAYAHRFGQRVCAALGLPVYFYEAAAQHPARRNLADVRRGGYEALRTSIARPEHTPDCGPAQLGPAGAVIVGARGPLVAFNVYLSAPDVAVAQQVARTIRAANPHTGVPGIKALGLWVNGQAQVSMNLVDPAQTGLRTALRVVQEAAAAWGARVTHTELVGLAPRAAFEGATHAELLLPPSVRPYVLEDRLAAVLEDLPT